MTPFWRKNQLVIRPKKGLTGELIIWRTKLQAKVQGRVQLKHSICFKWVQICSKEPRIWSGLNDILCTLEMNLPSLTASLPATTDLHGYERAKYLYHYLVFCNYFLNTFSKPSHPLQLSCLLQLLFKYLFKTFTSFTRLFFLFPKHVREVN